MKKIILKIVFLALMLYSPVSAVAGQENSVVLQALHQAAGVAIDFDVFFTEHKTSEQGDPEENVQGISGYAWASMASYYNAISPPLAALPLVWTTATAFTAAGELGDQATSWRAGISISGEFSADGLHLVRLTASVQHYQGAQIWYEHSIVFLNLPEAGLQYAAAPLAPANIGSWSYKLYGDGFTWSAEISDILWGYEGATTPSATVSFIWTAPIETTTSSSSTTTTIEPDVQLDLTYPAGPSPKVFTSGWSFGARCTSKQADGMRIDLSDQVQWSGTGVFTPPTGSRSVPVFNAKGPNTISLKVTIGGKEYTKDTVVEAVDSTLYAALGYFVSCPADFHHCMACPHSVFGFIIQGSSNVVIKGLPAARSGDIGTHLLSCCGPGVFTIESGRMSDVMIDGRPAAKIADPTRHCGGMGSIKGAAKAGISGRTRAMACSVPGSLPAPATGSGTLLGTVTTAAALPIKGLAVWAYGEGGTEPLWAETDATGNYSITGMPPGQYKVLFSNRMLQGSDTAPVRANGPYVAEWYKDDGSFSDAEPVTVTADAATRADASLAAGGSISGTIKDASGAAINKALVTAYGATTKIELWSCADATGAYTITGLPADTYTLLVRGSRQGYVDTWYGGGTAQTATPVTVADTQQVTGIYISLAAGGAITGKVTNWLHAPVAGIAVQAVHTATNLGGTAITADNGTYAVRGLPDGAYKIRFLAEAAGLANTWYPNAVGWDKATAVTITGAATMGGINIRFPFKGCAAARLLDEGSADLAHLRAFRDASLASNAVGRKIIHIYYRYSDSISAALDRSPALRTLARAALELIAPMAGAAAESANREATQRGLFFL